MYYAIRFNSGACTLCTVCTICALYRMYDMCLYSMYDMCEKLCILLTEANKNLQCGVSTRPQGARNRNILRV
jgi:hypothetical protein